MNLKWYEYVWMQSVWWNAYANYNAYKVFDEMPKLLMHVQYTMWFSYTQSKHVRSLTCGLTSTKPLETN